MSKKKTFNLKQLFLLICVVSMCGGFWGCFDRKSKFIDIRAASYNIRYRAVADSISGDSWNDRKVDVAQVIISNNFDIVGTQEGDEKQLQDLMILLPDYHYVGYPYGGKNGNLHNCATFYKSSKYEVLDSGVFWYSETPNVKSIGWDVTDLRICNWIKFKEKLSSQEFFFFNSHFYWKNKIARNNSGEVLIEKIKEIAGNKPVISTGDYNSQDTTPQIQKILTVLKDAYRATLSEPKGVLGTNLGGGNFKGPEKGRIDYIFVSSQIQVLDYAVLEDKRENGHFPSDHLPVVCNLRIW